MSKFLFTKARWQIAARLGLAIFIMLAATGLLLMTARHRSFLFLFGDLSDETFGREQQAGD